MRDNGSAGTNRLDLRYRRVARVLQETTYLSWAPLLFTSFLLTVHLCFSAHFKMALTPDKMISFEGEFFCHAYVY